MLVEYLLNASSTSLDSIPIPLSVMRINSIPPSSIASEMLSAPASREFSISSFTTEEGRSMTSPAAIFEETSVDNSFILMTKPFRCW